MRQSQVMQNAPTVELVDSVPATPAPEATPAPAPAPTPSPEVTPTPEATPAPEVTPEATPTSETPAQQLYKLPDGREVDAEGLRREYENLLPEFTRKSQELAQLKNQTPIKNEKQPWEDPDWQPSNWGEAMQIAKREALAEIKREAEQERAREEAVRQGVQQQMVEIKLSDPKVDENALYDHAVKYGFTDLKAAHLNYKEMRNIALQTEQRVTKNLAVRAADPIATSPTPPPVVKPSTDVVPGDISNYRGALDFLAAFKSKG